MSSKKIEEGSTAHKAEPAPAGGPAGGPTDQMPMGMTGAPAVGGGDPDQKSTHVPPNTVESTLPDGSPKYADAPKAQPARKSAKGGRYEVVARISTATQYDSEGRATKRAVFEPGDIIELDAEEAASLGAALKPAK